MTGIRAGVLLACLLTAACIPHDTKPADCDAASVSRSATLNGDRIEPETLDVCRDQRVMIDFEVDQDGVLHLHGYDDQGAAIQVRAGEPASMSFVAVRSGQFVIELHPADSAEGVGAGILIVHEP
jgi:hypothetical protein